MVDIHLGLQALRSTLRRYSDIIWMVSAAILLATFIVREEVRESYRNFADSLERARQNFESKRTLGDIQTQILVLSEGINHKDLSWGGRGPKSQLTPEQEYQLEMRLSNLLAYGNSLATRLGDDYALIFRLTAWQDFRAQADALSSVLSKNTKRGVELSNSYYYDRTTTADDVDQLAADQNDALNAIGDLEHDIQTAATHEAESRRSILSIVNWLSIGLFVAGWLISFIAKLAGIGSGELN